MRNTEPGPRIQKLAASGSRRGVFTLAGLVCAGCLWAGAARAQSAVTLAITNFPGNAIATNYSGLSFGAISLKPSSGGYFFDSSNTQMVTLFQQLGTRYLRIGGTSVDTNNSGYTPADPDVDALFRFASAAGVKVAYSLQLMNGDPARDAALAGYVWNNHRQSLDVLAIGNEPNLYGNQDSTITNFSSYLAQWGKFAAAITNVDPVAKFGGPDSDNGGSSWETNFAAHEAGSSIVTTIFFHYYVGGSSANLTIQQIIDQVLSTNWVASNYPGRYAGGGTPVLSLGFPYRMTEVNSYYTGGTAGVPGGNNCFATALFALDFMHWWTLQDCAGVCFHTSMWKYNGTFYPDAKGNYQVYPIGYGIKAFDFGGHGNVEPLVGVVNTNGLNLTAYAVADSTNLYVTIINKEHGTGARDATVTIQLNGFLPGSAAAMYLTAPGGNAAATNGITLGGAAITNSGPWAGQWTALSPATNGQCTVTVAACSAAIVKLAVAPGAPLIVSQTPVASPSPTVLCAGVNPFFSITAAGGGPLCYQWFSNGTPIVGATNASYAPATGSSGVTNNYDCIVTNFAGSATSAVWSVSTLPTSIASYPQAVLALHPVGYWRLNEMPDNGSGNQGTACHDFVGGDNGVYSNVVLAQAGYNPVTDPAEMAAGFGTVLASNSMAGQIGGIDFSAPAGGNAEFSVTAWVKCAPQGGGGAIIAKGYGNGGEQFVLDFGTGGAGHYFRFVVRNAAGAAVNANSTVQPDGSWHHLAAVCDESNGVVHLFIDGVDQADAAIAAGSGVQAGKAGAAGLGDNQVSIGARTQNSTAISYNLQTVGTIDEVAICNYALGSNQVRGLYAAGPVPAVQLTPSGGCPVINYTGTLQSSTNAGGPFAPVVGATNPFVVTPTAPRMFYRVSNP